MLLAESVLHFVALYSIALGLVTIGIRASGSRGLSLLPMTVLPAAAAALVLALRAARRLPQRGQVLSLLDAHNACGGLLVSAEDVDPGAWGDRIPPLVLPRVRWQPRRPVILCSAGALFLTLALLLPLDPHSAADANPLDVGAKAGELSNKITALEEAGAFEENKAASLQEKLDEVTDAAIGDDPAKTWEALDHLEAATAAAAAQSSEHALATTENLTKAEAIAEMLETQSSSIDAETVTEAMQELSRLTAADGSLPKGAALPRDIADALRNGQRLTPEQLRQLQASLQAVKGSLLSDLEELRDLKLIDIRDLQTCERAGKCTKGDLAAFLAECPRGTPLSEAIGAWSCRRPGAGGVSRGRGDAPLSLGPPADAAGTAFKVRVLPPASMAAIRDSRIMAMSAAAPTAIAGESDDTRTAPGALSAAHAGSGQAYTHRVLPEHRGTVKRYFEKEPPHDE